MTARELIKALQDLGEDNLDRKIIMFDGPSFFTPCTVKILNHSRWGDKAGLIMID